MGESLSVPFELRGWRFKSLCCHFKFRYRAYFKQCVPWHLGNYRVYIDSETRTWYDNRILFEISFFISFQFVSYYAVYLCKLPVLWLFYDFVIYIYIYMLNIFITWMGLSNFFFILLLFQKMCQFTAWKILNFFWRNLLNFKSEIVQSSCVKYSKCSVNFVLRIYVLNYARQSYFPLLNTQFFRLPS